MAQPIRAIGDDLGEGGGADVVAVADGLDGAVDDGAVVAEEEAAHGGRRGDEDDVPEVIGRAVPGSCSACLRCAGHVNSSGTGNVPASLGWTWVSRS